MTSNTNRTFLLLLLYQRESNKSKKQSRYLKKYYQRLEAQRQRLRQRRIPRNALHLPSCSVWRQLYNSRGDQAFITLTELDCKTFHWLVCNFHSIFDSYLPWVLEDGYIAPLQLGIGCPRLIDSANCLGLCLAWRRTRGSNMALQLIFGLTATPLSMYLRFSRRRLVECLRKNMWGKQRIPTEKQIKFYKACVRKRHPALKDVWCTMDGLRLPLQQSGNTLIQNNFYNGWTHDHYVTNIFCFCPDVTIPICMQNLP
jgi:hypothetical protein